MKKFLSLLFALLSMVTLSAQTQLHEGDNVLPRYADANAFYEVTAEGNIEVTVSGDFLTLTHNETVISDYSFIAVGPKYLYNLTGVKAGDRLIFTGWPMNEVTVTITLLQEGAYSPIKLVEATPEDGVVFPWDRAGQISMTFSKNVAISSAQMLYGEEVRELALHLNGVYASTDIQSVLSAALKDGSLHEGDEFTVRFNDVADAAHSDNLYGTDGTLVLHYTAPAVQAQLVSTSFAERSILKSYYAADDAAGVFTMTFDQPLSTEASLQAQAELTYGNIDYADQNLFYHEVIPTTIEGNTLKMDLRDKIRTKHSMLAGDTDILGEDILSTITLSVHGIRDSKGNYVYSPGEGTIGSFTYVLTLVAPELTDFTCEVTPASSAAHPVEIKEGDKIEFWFSDADLFSLGTPGGFRFTSEKDGQTVSDELLLNYLKEVEGADAEETYYEPATDGTDLIVVGEVDEYGGRSIWLTVPNLNQHGELVTITPVGIVTADVIDHCAEYAQVYKYVASVSPLAVTLTKTDWKRVGSENGENVCIATLAEGQAFDHFEAEIRCTEDPTQYVTFAAAYTNPGTLTCYDSQPLYKGYHYTLIVKAFDVPYYGVAPIATYEYAFVGEGVTPTPYNHEMTVESVALEPCDFLLHGYYSTETAFDVTFTEPATKVVSWWAQGFDGSVKVDAVQKSEDGKTWTLTLPGDFLGTEGAANVMIQAWDAEGVQMFGENGDHAYSINIQYGTAPEDPSGIAGVTTSAAPQPIYNLAGQRITSPTGIVISEGRTMIR